MKANEIIASTFGWDVKEVSDHRYQEGRQSMPVYSIGDFYYCVPSPGRLPPKGWKWKAHTDQFFAQRAERILYAADMDDDVQQ